MAKAYKFDDCKTCRFRPRRGRPSPICDECDCGEMYEDASISSLRFDDAPTGFDRANKSLVTDDDEPNFNPDDLIQRLDNEAENNDDDT